MWNMGPVVERNQTGAWRNFGDFTLEGRVRHTKDGVPYPVGIVDP